MPYSGAASTYFLDHIGAGLIPLTYAVILFASIGYFFSTKKFDFFRTSQPLLLLLLPFLLQRELGGFLNGSAVTIWAFFAPLAAMLFADIVHARAWMLAFLGLTIISGALDSIFAAPRPRVLFRSQHPHVDSLMVASGAGWLHHHRVPVSKV